MKHIKKLILDKSSDALEEEVFEALAKDVLEGLNVDLVSIWYFNDDHSVLTCKYSLDRNKKINLKDFKLLEKDYPHYFNAIIEMVSLKADDVYTHPGTKELIKDYLEPYKIYSLLDYLICEGGKKTGLICCETTSGKRIWQEDDVDLIRVLTVMAGVELKNTHQN
tara:strand:- start:30886 stop:31380 length:495 start_codon:yes stop_codon:yes gene_type:complete